MQPGARIPSGKRAGVKNAAYTAGGNPPDGAAGGKSPIGVTVGWLAAAGLPGPRRGDYKRFPSWNFSSSKVILPSTLYFLTAPSCTNSDMQRSRPLSDLLIERQTRLSSVMP